MRVKLEHVSESTLRNKEKPSEKRTVGKYGYKKSLIMLMIAVLLAAAPVFVKMIVSSAEISEAFKPMSRAITRVLSGIFGILPFSAAEILLYLLILGILAYIIATAIAMVREEKKLGIFFRAVSTLALTAASLVFIFNLCWGMNYYSLSLADELGMDVGRYSAETLRLTAASFATELNRLAGEVPRNSEDIADFGAFSGMAKMAAEGWKKLAAEDEAFRGAAAAAPKRVLMSKAMSYTGITGIYIPFTGEANVNADIPDTAIPFTMSHEMAHAAGVAPENEANFAAFLACRTNPNPIFQYSGYLEAFVFTYNALIKEDAQAAADIRASLDRRVEADMRVRSAYWARHDGKVSVAASKVNNTYLMAMSQADGVKSYGMVVDLLIADYVSHNGNPDNGKQLT